MARSDVIAGRIIPVRISYGLLIVQFVLLFHSTLWNSVTFDEVQHLPAGVSYWHKGRFFSYHHNPPVTKLLFALPAVLTNVPVSFAHYYYEPGSRHSDYLFGKDFATANRANYQSVFVRCRLVTAILTALGGWLIFAWGRELFGERAALLSQALWTFCPMVLAHGGLVTPDMGATVVGLLATYLYWKYLRDPQPRWLVPSAIALGLAIGSKFSLVILPSIWFALAFIAFIRLRVDDTGQPPWRRLCLDAAVMVFGSLLTLNTVYLFEGSGMPLGRMKLFSKPLTRFSEQPPATPRSAEGSPLTQHLWKWLPMPFPKHFTLGLDQQMFDTRPGEAYLGGEMRNGRGWWYYYLYAFVVKSPIGTLALILLATFGFAIRSIRSGLLVLKTHLFSARSSTSRATTRVVDRATILTAATLILPVAVTLAMVSANTMLNKHSRYMLQAYPFIYLMLGPLAIQGVGWFARAIKSMVVGAITINVISVLLVHPFYLTYFNELAGGPGNGYKHLIDSNIDWGQGLVALRQWLDDHSIHEPIQLAYFGNVDPGIYKIQFSTPGTLDNPSSLQPGLHVISVNYVAGSSVPPINSFGGRQVIPANAYRFYARFAPEATIANCFQVFMVSEKQIEQLLSDSNKLSRSVR